MSYKVAIIGAGSAVFSGNLICDILQQEPIRDCHIALMDPDAERLRLARSVARQAAETFGARPKVTAGKGLAAALTDANYVIYTVGVGGIDATLADLDVPHACGVRQTIADTLGVGGIFRAVRGVPVLLDVCRKMEKLCPRALLINYANPMAMHCLAVQRHTRVRAVGLCHGVEHSLQWIQAMIWIAENVTEKTIRKHLAKPWGAPARIGEWADWMGAAPNQRLNHTCAGINHLAFFLKLRRKGEDLYRRLWAAFETPQVFLLDPVRIEMARLLGYYMTETSGHCAEYVPWFLKHPRERKRLGLRVNSYARTCRDQEAAVERVERDVADGKRVIDPKRQLSVEYASRIIRAIETGRAFGFNGNVNNGSGDRLISNLPDDCCVEVPCVADAKGIRPRRMGALPPQCAALIRTNANVQDLTVRGIVEGDRRRILQAMAMDPNTAGALTLPQIARLCDEMLRAHRKHLPKGLRDGPAVRR